MKTWFAALRRRWYMRRARSSMAKDTGGRGDVTARKTGDR